MGPKVSYRVKLWLFYLFAFLPIAALLTQNQISWISFFSILLAAFFAALFLRPRDNMKKICEPFFQAQEQFWEENRHLHERFVTLSQTAQACEIPTHTLTERHLSRLHLDFMILEDALKSISESLADTEILSTSSEEGLHQMVTIMQKMLAASSNIVTTLFTLQEEVANINQVIVAIVKIADQSNLLSLNTAIRANKSGSQGKGFTVIAVRIREMADQIALATLDIEKAVQEIVEAVRQAAESVTHFSQQVRNQDLATEEVARKLKELIDHTEQQLHHFSLIKSTLKGSTLGRNKLHRRGRDFSGKVQRLVP